MGRRLLSVARDHKIAILFTCSAGACGACLVEVAHPSGGLEAPPPFSAEETLLLQAMGKLPPAAGAIAAAAGAFVQWRLACQYIVTEATIVVRYSSDLGSL